MRRGGIVFVVTRFSGSRHFSGDSPQRRKTKRDAERPSPAEAGHYERRQGALPQRFDVGVVAGRREMDDALGGGGEDTAKLEDFQARLDLAIRPDSEADG